MTFQLFTLVLCFNSIEVMDDVCLESATLNTVRQLSHLCIPFSSLQDVLFASHRVGEMVAFESASLFLSVAVACSSHLLRQNLPAYTIFTTNHCPI